MTAANLAILLDGGRAVVSLVVALCFLRLGRSTKDRLYPAFAFSFVLLALSCVLVGLGVAPGDRSELAFVPRLVAFLLIIAAIVDKNRRART